MRMYGEKPISSIPVDFRHTPWEHKNRYKKVHKINCATCGKEVTMRYAKLKQIMLYSSGKPTCYACYTAGKSEVADAVAALNARKAAMRKKK